MNIDDIVAAILFVGVILSPGFIKLVEQELGKGMAKILLLLSVFAFLSSGGIIIIEFGKKILGH